MATTYNDLTLDIRRRLRQAGIEAATLEARELVCFAAGKDKARLLRDDYCDGFGLSLIHI